MVETRVRLLQQIFSVGRKTLVTSVTSGKAKLACYLHLLSDLFYEMMEVN